MFFQIVFQSENYNASCNSKNFGLSGGKRVSAQQPFPGKRSEVFLWGSNSSHQLGDSTVEKYTLPKLSTVFEDVMIVS